MTRRPPADATLEQALALGGNRNPTTAHPDCTCVPTAPCKHLVRFGWMPGVICHDCKSRCTQHGARR